MQVSMVEVRRSKRILLDDDVGGTFDVVLKVLANNSINAGGVFGKMNQKFDTSLAYL